MTSPKPPPKDRASGSTLAPPPPPPPPPSKSSSVGYVQSLSKPASSSSSSALLPPPPPPKPSHLKNQPPTEASSDSSSSFQLRSEAPEFTPAWMTATDGVNSSWMQASACVEDSTLHWLRPEDCQFASDTQRWLAGMSCISSLPVPAKDTVASWLDTAQTSSFGMCGAASKPSSKQAQDSVDTGIGSTFTWLGGMGAELPSVKEEEAAPPPPPPKEPPPCAVAKNSAPTPGRLRVTKRIGLELYSPQPGVLAMKPRSSAQAKAKSPVADAEDSEVHVNLAQSESPLLPLLYEIADMSNRPRKCIVEGLLDVLTWNWICREDQLRLVTRRQWESMGLPIGVYWALMEKLGLPRNGPGTLKDSTDKGDAENDQKSLRS